MKQWWLLILLNLPLLQEATRKYFIHSDLVFLAGDLLVLGTVSVLGIRGSLNFESLPAPFLALSALFVVLTSFNHVLSNNHIGLYGIGLRATFLPLVYLLLSARYISAANSGYERIFLCVNIWILIIGVMAILQVLLGKNHPINSVWGKAAVGIGDYTAHDRGVLIPGLFRPTSIFTHTGKFGQVIFTLVLFKWCYLLLSQIRRPRWLYLFMLFDLGVIFTSGQRAALVFLVLAMIMVTLVRIDQLGTHLKRALVPSVIIFAGLFAAWIVIPELAVAVYDRFASVISTIPARLEGNFWLPMKTMLEDYMFSGQGLGYFTFGSRLFGGTQVYDAVKMEGLGESSLIRLCGEVGVVGTVILVFAFLSLAAKSFQISIANNDIPYASCALFFSIWLACLMLWSNTADIFANSIVTSLGYALSGAALYKATPKL